MKNKGIKKQALLLILSCCLLTLFLSGGIAIYGMTDIKSSAEETGREIGQSAAGNSSKALHEDAQQNLSQMLEERGERIDMVFDNLGTDVGMIVEEMNELQNHPERYPMGQVQEPQRSNAGILVPQLQFAPDVMRDDPALQQEIALAANIQDWLLRLNASQDMVASVYIASRNGFGITVDNRSDQKFHAGEEVPFAIDFRTRPWYREAEKAKRMIYSSIFMDVYSRNYGITCAAPYFTGTGEVAGVVGAGMFLNHIKEIVSTTSIGETGFGFVIDKQGRVLFSPKTEGSLAAVDISGGASLFEASDASLAAVAHDMAEGKTGLQKVLVDGVPCYLAYRPLKAMACSFGIIMEVAEVTMPAKANEQVIEDSTNAFLDTLNHSIRSSLLAVLVLVMLLLLLVPFLSDKVATRLVQPIHELSDGVREIASGNLEKKLDIRTGNEIEQLAVCFNNMTDSLKESMENLARATEEKERQNAELRKKNEELSNALHNVKQLRIARDNYRVESETDRLTQIYNKAAAERICKKKCRDLPKDKKAAFYIIDLDHFKEANDTFGHQYGDRILSGFALQLKHIFREEDCLGRFGGDEFVVMMEGSLSQAVIRRKAQTILEVARELRVDGEPCGITASIGIAIAPIHGADYASLFQVADNALYYVKKHGRDGVCIGTDDPPA